jgi:hypothetical protein
MPRFGLLSLTLIGLSTGLVAQEKVPAFVDMRLNLEGVDLAYSVDVNNTGESDETFDLATRAGVSWTGSLGINTWGGVIWGLGGAWGYQDKELDTGPSFSLQTLTLDLFIGYAYAFTEGLQVEIAPVVGVGRAWVHQDGNPELSGHDRIWEYGLRSSLAWTLGNGFQCGLTASMLRSETEILADAKGGGQVESEFLLNRFTVGGFIGVRL